MQRTLNRKLHNFIKFVIFLKSIINCLQNPTLTFEFQTSTLKLLVYNYVIVLLIANQEVGWSYSFKGKAQIIDYNIQKLEFNTIRFVRNRFG